MSKIVSRKSKGLSLKEFDERYGTEEKCQAAVTRMKWPDGFVCSKCDSRKYVKLRDRKLFQCSQCQHQESLTAGTIFHYTKLPLTLWFMAMYLLTQTKKGISSVELAEKLGVHQETAWNLKQKLMQVMLERESQKSLAGRIEIDDAYWGGRRSMGKRGRGSENKKPFIAAVQTDNKGKPVKIKLAAVKGFRKTEIKKWTDKNVEKKSNIVSDGLSCFKGVNQAGCNHEIIVVGKNRKSSDIPAFKWVNTVLGNLKTALTGTYHSLGADHIPRYLAEFAYRFNRRYDMANMIERLTYAAVRTPPLPGRLLKLAESRR